MDYEVKRKIICVNIRLEEEEARQLFADLNNIPAGVTPTTDAIIQLLQGTFEGGNIR